MRKALGFVVAWLLGVGLFSVSDHLIAGSVQIPDDKHIGFSGIEYHVPRNTRMVLYKYKANKNKTIGEAGQLDNDTRQIREFTENNRTTRGVDSDLVSDCGIAIGNTSKPDLFAPKEQVVIIEGDVVNLGECN